MSACSVSNLYTRTSQHPSKTITFFVAWSMPASFMQNSQQNVELSHLRAGRGNVVMALNWPKLPSCPHFKSIHSYSHTQFHAGWYWLTWYSGTVWKCSLSEGILAQFLADWKGGKTTISCFSVQFAGRSKRLSGAWRPLRVKWCATGDTSPNMCGGQFTSAAGTSFALNPLGFQFYWGVAVL